MINLPVDLSVFLTEYWQKKPLVLRKAITNFNNPLSPDELAGLALEEDIESRLVWKTPGKLPEWHLRRGPFHENDFSSLPPTHWTLLVQGVDRIVPEVSLLFDHFKFIPQWRMDDVMISYAVNHGSVGPHYDHYDVFLYQTSGRRKWFLTTQLCKPENYIANVELRIMKEFVVEDEFILEPGDMLYLPPHVGHHGVSLSDDCMTYSFGYRSYRGQELLYSLGEYLEEQGGLNPLYSDPNWSNNRSTVLIPPQAWKNAQNILCQMLQEESVIKTWFASYVTTLDAGAEQQLLEPDEQADEDLFASELPEHAGLIWDPVCRRAYLESPLQLFINGVEWEISDVDPQLVKYVANERELPIEALIPFLEHKANTVFIYKLWQLQWLQWIE
jgi:50S ribosomal protein L16 3-hydroxylase